MVNLFPEIVPEGGKESAFLSRTPGLRKLATYGNGPIRGMWQFGEYCYVVSGQALYRVDKNWVGMLLGTVDGTGPVSMASNTHQVMLATDPNGYIYDVNTQVFSQIPIGQFLGAKVVSYISPGYFVVMTPNSSQFQISNLGDGTVWDPLDISTVDASPDALVSLITDHNELWLLGTDSVEVWYFDGNSDFPFTHIQGAFNEIGCAATYSLAKMDNCIYWLGSDARGAGIVYRSQGYTGKRVSTHSVEWQIQQYGDISSAVAYTYQQDGHQFYVLTFPSAGTTWVYDVSTDAWHERAGFADGVFARHRSNCQAAFADEVIIGDYLNGNVYALDLQYHQDDGSTQKWLRSWRALPSGHNDLKRTAHHSLQLDCETGVGVGNVYAPSIDSRYIVTELLKRLLTEASDYITTENQGQYLVPSTPNVMLRWSDDGGHTWSNEHWRSMGKIGEYFYRVIWRRLGMAIKLRDRVYEVSGTDPVKIYIMGAELFITPTAS